MLRILTYKIDIYETKKWSQGHKVKGQGQICNYTITTNIIGISLNHGRFIVS